MARPGSLREVQTMGGFFGVASASDCVEDVFFGTDYHSHLGTRRGGMVTTTDGRFKRTIHDITNAQFRTKFEDDLGKHRGNLGLGVISDYEDQPLIIGVAPRGLRARHGRPRQQRRRARPQGTGGSRRRTSREMSGGEFNPTELVATLDQPGGDLRRGDPLGAGARSTDRARCCC